MNRSPVEKPLDEVKDEIRADAESARQRVAAGHGRKARVKSVAKEHVEVARNEFSIEELSRSNFTAFLEQAFSALLRRTPDPAGFEAQMALLVAGRSKSEILGNLRWSREGRDIGVRVPGLLPRYLLAKVMRIPVLGYMIEWLVCLAGLPRIVRHQRAADTYHSARQQELGVMSRSIMDHVEVLLIEVGRLGSDNPELSAKLKHLFDRVGPLHAELERVSGEAVELRHLVLSMNHWLASLRQNLAALEQAEAEEARESNALYAEIAKRVLAADPGRPARIDDWARQFARLLPERASVLDICSGVDWMARLFENGLDATGCDTNERTATQAVAGGLSMTVSEPAEFLARTADRSLQGLSAIDAGSVLRSMSAFSFLAIAQRILVPGGFVLLGVGNGPARIAARLDGRGDPGLDAELVMQSLAAAGFIEVQRLEGAGGACCIVAKNAGEIR